MMFSPAEIASILLVFVFAGFVKGVIGIGLPTVTLALLTGPLGLKSTLAIILLPMVATNIWQALTGPYLTPLLRRLWPYLLAAIAGIWTGVQVLATARAELLVALLAVILICNAVISFTRFRIPPPRAGRERAWSVASGALGGVMFGMTGNFIVPGIMFLQALGLRRDMMVQALGITLLTISAGLTVSMGARALVTPVQLAWSAAMLVPAFCGMWLGTRYRNQISETQFRGLFYAGLLLIGLWLLYGALGKLGLF